MTRKFRSLPARAGGSMAAQDIQSQLAERAAHAASERERGTTGTRDVFLLGPKRNTLAPEHASAALWLDETNERADDVMEQREQLRLERPDPAQRLGCFPASERFAR